MAEQNGSLQNKDTFLHKKVLLHFHDCASKSISDFILKLKKSAERSKFMQILDMHMQIYSRYIYIYSRRHIDLYPAVFSLQKRFHRHWDFPFHLTPYSGAGDPSKASVSEQPGAKQPLEEGHFLGGRICVCISVSCDWKTWKLRHPEQPQYLPNDFEYTFCLRSFRTKSDSHMARLTGRGS